MATTYVEYASIPALTRPTILVTVTDDRKNTLTLEHHPAGYYPAGSMARHTDRDLYLVTWHFYTDGTSHGQYYRTLAEAIPAYRAKLRHAVEYSERVTAEQAEEAERALAQVESGE